MDYFMIDIVPNTKAIHKWNILKCSSSSFGHENLNGQLYNIGEIIWTIWYGSYSNFEKTVSDNSVLETILRRDLDAWRVIFAMDPLAVFMSVSDILKNFPARKIRISYLGTIALLLQDVLPKY